MKKYKHKKTGYIAEEKDTFYCLKNQGNLPKWLVENSDDWEELVEEKDYEILSFYHNNKLFNKDHAKSSKDYPYWSKENTWLTFNDRICKIHSVKRISDGQIFTVGDKIKNGVIKNIIIKDDKIYLEV